MAKHGSRVNRIPREAGEPFRQATAYGDDLEFLSLDRHEPVLRRLNSIARGRGNAAIITAVGNLTLEKAVTPTAGLGNGFIVRKDQPRKTPGSGEQTEMQSSLRLEQNGSARKTHHNPRRGPTMR